MNSNHGSHASASAGKSGNGKGKYAHAIPSAKTVARMAKTAKKELKSQMEERPFATVAIVGGVTFALGALVGTRIGRLVIAAAVPLLVKRAFEGTLVADAEEFVRPLMNRLAKESADD